MTGERNERVGRLTRRHGLGVAGSAGIGAFAAACGPWSGAGGDGAGGGSAADREVVVAAGRDLGLGPQDPYFTTSSPMVWEPLVGLDDALKPKPVLAEKWDVSADGRTWTFRLRQGVTFGDGTPFDADTVVANLKRYMQISPRPSSGPAMDVRVGYGRLADVRKIDTHTVAFISEEPNPAMVNTMTNYFSSMHHPREFAENGDFRGLPINTGPFKVAEWRPAEFLLLERNETYWGTKPSVKRIRVRYMPDANARVSALLASEIEGVVELGAILPAQAEQLKGRPGIIVGSDPTSETSYLAFNCGKPPFNDVRLRRAVSMAVDRDSITKDLVLGYGTPGKSILSPIATQWFSPKGTPKFSMADAQKLAGEALGGRRVAVQFPFDSTNTRAPFKAIGELLQQTLRPLGLDISLQSRERAALTLTLNNGDWNVCYFTTAWANGDPDFLFSRLMRTGSILTGNAPAGYSNAQADALIAAGKVEGDERKRVAIYEQLQELSVQDAAVVPLYHLKQPYAYRDSLSGLRIRTNFQPTLDTIKIVK